MVPGAKAVAVSKIEPVISVGCLVTWKRDSQFRANNHPQMDLFFQKYGHGPFFVKEIKLSGKFYFVVISTDDGYKEINSYYLELVESFLDPAEIATD